MTRFNLHEATLMDVSGELSAKTQKHLHDHLSRDRAARAQAEEIRAGFALLRGVPLPAMSAADVGRIAGQLKLGVQREVRQVSRKRNGEVRRRFVYGALAGVSGVAACLLITLSVMSVVQKQAHSREMAIAKAEDSIRDFMNADADNMTDVSLASLNKQINKANDLQDQWSPTENSGNRARLLELVDPTPDEEMNDTGT